MAVNGCFHKPEYIFCEVNHVFHKVSYQTEVLTDVTPYGKLMEAYGSFHISLNIFVMKLAMLSMRFP